jgi:putative two-component system protein, hydrogenase maturation factor HypX/HoxX
MRILLLVTDFNSLTQRVYVELADAGHDLAVGVARGASEMAAAVESFPPDVIVAPYLKSIIPESIWRSHTCLIVHPGIRGDRGPSSLDWAILNGEQSWGVTVVQATAELDAGAVWAYREFPMRRAAKSALYRHEVTDAAVEAVLEALTRFQNGYVPEPVDRQPDVRGRLEPLMTQRDRAIDETATTEIVLRKLLCSNSHPGVLDALFGQSYYVFGGYREEHLTGRPGELLAQRAGAVCRATGDGAVWITHLKHPRTANSPTCKLPATVVLADQLASVPKLDSFLADCGDVGSYREVWYEERNDVGYVNFEFYNGAMSAHQCRALRDAFLWARQRPTKVIVLVGGQDLWSTGIDLNAIETAANPERESWLNINAMNDVVCELITTNSHWVISALAGNAAAGGVSLALAADEVYARSGVVFNPHYKKMGLYGSEYWTYLLPGKVGQERALDLTESCLPIGTRRAKEIGLVDAVFSSDLIEFRDTVRHVAESLARSADFELRLHLKRQARRRDEDIKALATYRAEELVKMAVDFGDPRYHQARQNFVYKSQLAGSASGFQLTYPPNVANTRG